MLSVGPLAASSAVTEPMARWARVMNGSTMNAASTVLSSILACMSGNANSLNVTLSGLTSLASSVAFAVSSAMFLNVLIAMVLPARSLGDLMGESAVVTIRNMSGLAW